MNSTRRTSVAFRSVLLALLAFVPSSLFASAPAYAVPSDVVISQVYGGGGTTWSHDFIELHNRGTSPVNISGWSVQYGSATGSTWSSTVIFGTIPAGGYYLIQQAAGAGGAALPAPDASDNITMNATAGKVVLVSNSNLLIGVPPADESAIVDAVGYGAANYSEGPPTPPLSATTAALRGNNGCTDTNHNLNDFTIGIPVPRNTASTPFSCQQTSVLLTSTPNPSQVGESVILTATVTPPAATGMVEFRDGVTVLGTSSLSSGSAVLNTSSLAIGAHALTAAYLGDGTYTPGTSPVHNHTVNQASTTTTLAGSPDPSVFGQQVTFTATVAAVPPGAGTPGGMVEFFDGVTSLGQVALAAGQAQLLKSDLAVGPHTLTAQYLGEASFTGSLSPTDNHTVDQATTTTALVGSPDPSVFGQQVTFTATVAAVPPGAGIPSGMVEFFDGVTSLGQVALAAGQAQLLKSDLAVGPHTLTAQYLGEASFTGSLSPTDNHTVDQASTTTALVGSPDPSVFGQQVTFTATVAAVAPGAGTPGGMVEFFDGVTSLGQVALAAGQAQLLKSDLAVGVHTLTAQYLGEASFTGSLSPTDNHTVDQASTTTALVGSPDPSVFGQQVTFTATVAAVAPGSGTPSGMVEFFNGVTSLGQVALAAGQAQLLKSDLAVGVHTLTAQYLGEASFTGSLSPTDNHTVGVTATTTALVGSPDPSVFGQQVTFTATVAAVPPGSGTPSGMVEFFNGVTSLGQVALAAGQAQLVKSDLAVGVHTLTAQYLGEASFTGSLSPTDEHTVNKAATTTSLSGSPDPSVAGQAVTFTATVVAVPPGAGAPGGMVEFFNGVTSLGTGPVVAGQAQLVTLALPVDVYTLTAQYLGDASFTGSVSPPDNHTVDPVGALVVVSQVYGGGGVSSPFTHDYVELFNRSAHPVDLSTWSVQYATATGTTWTVTPLSGLIPARGYFLVQQAPGIGVPSTLPTPEVVGSTDIDATSGKVALVNNQTSLSLACPDGSTVVDKLGYGAANCSETSPAPGLTSLVASLRNFGGCVDTDNNSADFAVGLPNPRNSASPTNDCMFTLTVLVDSPGGGTVNISPNQTTFAPGALVLLTPEDDIEDGYHFDRWSGDASGIAEPLQVTMNGDVTITAHYVSNVPAGQVVISQFFGGGGTNSTGYKSDYVVLYNRGNEQVFLTNWTIQYAPASGAVWNAAALNGRIRPQSYYLVKLFTPPLGEGSELETPSVTGALDLDAVEGKLALVNSSSVLEGLCPNDGTIKDLVGYGGASCSETTPAASSSNTEAVFRGDGGCIESNNNLADFANGTPAPKDSLDTHFCTIWADAGGVMPTELALSPPSPNPSRGRFNFSLGLPVEGKVRVTVSDVMGRRVASLLDGSLPAGRHNLSWTGVGEAGPVRAGLYYLTLENAGQRMVRRFVIVR